MRGAGGPRSAVAAMNTRSAVVVNVSTSELDYAMGDVPLYHRLSRDIKAGRV